MENTIQVLTIVGIALTLIIVIALVVTCIKVVEIAKHVTQPSASELRAQALACGNKGLTDNAKELLNKALYKGLAESKGNQAEMERIIRITKNLAESIEITLS